MNNIQQEDMDSTKKRLKDTGNTDNSIIIRDEPLRKKRTIDQTHNNTNIPEYNFNKFCYRHDPDIQSTFTHTACYKQDLKRVQDINDRISKLNTTEQSELHHIISKFTNSNDKIRTLIIDGILNSCCFPQLSYASTQLKQMIKIDFLSILPQELSLKILSYLDCESLCQATMVCQRWKRLADDDRVWYHMCQQHIDRKCPNCGWGLPLLHMKNRAKMIRGKKNNAKDIKSEDSQSKMNPWKIIYRDRFKVELNWRRGKCIIKEFKGHMDGILSMRFNYRFLFSGSYDSTIGIWDLFTGKLIRRLSGHNDGVKTLFFDGSKLITGSLDKTIRVWNYITGECVSTYRGHTDSVMSVDSFKKIIVSGSADKTVRIWHIESRTCYTLRGHTEWVNCVKLHPKSFSCYSCSDDTTIRMWDIRTNTCLKVFRGHVGQVQKVIPLRILDIENLIVDTNTLEDTEEENITENNTDENENMDSDNVALDENLPYPTHLLSCSLDNTIKLWDVKTGKCIRTQFGHVEGVWDIAADTFRIISGSHDGSIKVWDLQSGKCMHTFHGKNLQKMNIDGSSADTTNTSNNNNTENNNRIPPISCVDIGDSEFFSGDERGCVKMYKFDLDDNNMEY
ncbi:F-box protein Met30p [Monosporozyma unispora]